MLKVLGDTFMGYLKNSLRKWFSKEPWFERFFVEPDMFLLGHHSEEPFSVPDGTFMFLCVRSATSIHDANSRSPPARRRQRHLQCRLGKK